MTADDADRYARLASILEGARELGGARLDSYLLEHCGDDAALRTEVLELLTLASDEGQDDLFAERSLANARQALEALADDADPSWLPETIGSYRIVRQVGRGGMGVVYEAEQLSPHRRVAIKLLHPMQTTAKRSRRFQQEATLLGRLQHPGIAQIFEAGTYDAGRGPQPFFAMELVDGVDIRTHCERADLDRGARIELLARVADAVHYAHDHGVVHRDLKPDNVLVNQHGQPRILDFGIARATDSTPSMVTALTDPGQLVGTLAYMAPEQLNQTEEEVTPRVDVYALGVLAFELLTGRLPRTVEDLPVSKAIAVLAGADPPRAGQLDPSLKGDLETILGKALEAEPVRRYANASALASDLRRYLAHQPIEARPPSRIYLIRKFTQRHRGFVGGVVATLLVAIAGAIVAGQYALAANRNARDAIQRASELERAGYIAGIAAANSAVQQQDFATAAARLDRTPVVHRGWEYRYLRAQLIQFSDEWEAAPTHLMSNMVFAPDGGRLIAMLFDGSIGTWDTATGRLVRSAKIGGIRSGDAAAGSAALHGPSLRYAATAAGGEIVIGSLQDPSSSPLPIAALQPHPEAPAVPIAWDTAGRQLIYRTRGTWIWDGTLSRQLSTERGPAAFSAAGDRVALASNGILWLLDAATGEELAQRRFDDQIVALEFAPNGDTLAVTGYYRNAYLLNGRTLDIDVRLVGHQDAVHRVTWTPDGSRLVTTSQDGTARVWSADGRGVSSVHSTGEHGERAIEVCLEPDGTNFVVAGQRLRRFPVGEPAALLGHESYVYFLAFSPDGSLLASSDWKGRDLRIWDVDRARLRWQLRSSGSVNVAFSADGRRLVGLARDTRQWDVATGTELLVTPAHSDSREQFFATLGRRLWLEENTAIDSHGSRLASFAGSDGTVFLFEQSATPSPNPAPANLPAGEGFWVSTGQLVGHVGRVYSAAFSPDGTRIATGGNDTTVRIWDTHTYEQLLVLRGHEQYVSYVAFSPDGTLLASASGDATIRLWDTLPLHERRARGEQR